MYGSATRPTYRRWCDFSACFARQTCSPILLSNKQPHSLSLSIHFLNPFLLYFHPTHSIPLTSSPLSLSFFLSLLIKSKTLSFFFSNSFISLRHFLSAFFFNSPHTLYLFVPLYFLTLYRQPCIHCICSYLFSLYLSSFLFTFSYIFLSLSSFSPSLSIILSILDFIHIFFICCILFSISLSLFLSVSLYLYALAFTSLSHPLLFVFFLLFFSVLLSCSLSFLPSGSLSFLFVFTLRRFVAFYKSQSGW